MTPAALGPTCPWCLTEDHPEHGCAGSAAGDPECCKPYAERRVRHGLDRVILDIRRGMSGYAVHAQAWGDVRPEGTATTQASVPAALWKVAKVATSVDVAELVGSLLAAPVTEPASVAEGRSAAHLDADRATLAIIPEAYRVDPTCEEPSAYRIAVGASVGAMLTAIALPRRVAFRIAKEAATKAYYQAQIDFVDEKPLSERIEAARVELNGIVDKHLGAASEAQGSPLPRDAVMRIVREVAWWSRRNPTELTEETLRKLCDVYDGTIVTEPVAQRGEADEESVEREEDFYAEPADAVRSALAKKGAV